MGIDRDSFRSIVGNFATGVTVITTKVEDRLHGFTANAVTSLSLDPLLLLVCVDKAANAHAEIEKAGSFGVNILAHDQRDISQLFAEKGQPESGRLRGDTPYALGDHGVPLIDGCLGTLECEVAGAVEGGDHTIFIGRVVSGSADSQRPPLLFFRGTYAELA